MFVSPCHALFSLEITNDSKSVDRRAACLPGCAHRYCILGIHLSCDLTTVAERKGGERDIQNLCICICIEVQCLKQCVFVRIPSGHMLPILPSTRTCHTPIRSNTIACHIAVLFKVYCFNITISFAQTLVHWRLLVLIAVCWRLFVPTVPVQNAKKFLFY